MGSCDHTADEPVGIYGWDVGFKTQYATKVLIVWTPLNMEEIQIQIAKNGKWRVRDLISWDSLKQLSGLV